MVANNIIHTNANGEGNSLLNGDAIDLFVVQFSRGGVDDGGSKLAQIQNFGAGNALLDEALQCQIDNFGCLLVFRADVTVRCRCFDSSMKRVVRNEGR